MSFRLTFLCLVLAGMLFGCRGGARPDFGTFPQVEVPIEKKPEQDPTLFRDDNKDPPDRVSTDPPDPTPLRMKDQVDYEVRFNKGEVTIVSTRLVALDAPRSTPRKIGRFAFELWTGAQLIERLRFDFPLLGASSAEDKDVIEAGLITSTKIRIPLAARATSARILDRKTRRVISVPWPPEADFSQETPSAASQE